ncbi:helix-turn-helix transcriptional regulator [Terrarubrum flagellatum]|uniref:helix-turn-helix domain-containing protein n=1 Tax=Terrirubrum flagellatum TaxID=2895980 RepID=UPI003145519C
MAEVQIIKSPTGEEMVVLSRADYNALVAAAADVEEDENDVATYDRRKLELASGEEELLPADVSAMLLDGHTLLRALRKWRSLTQTELSNLSGVGQGFISDIEAGRRIGADDTLKKLAVALSVPESWLRRK